MKNTSFYRQKASSKHICMLTHVLYIYMAFCESNNQPIITQIKFFPSVCYTQHSIVLYLNAAFMSSNILWSSFIHILIQINTKVA